MLFWRARGLCYKLQWLASFWNNKTFHNRSLRNRVSCDTPGTFVPPFWIVTDIAKLTNPVYIPQSNVLKSYPFNPLRRGQNGRLIPNYMFKCIFLNENIWISFKISLKFVPKFRNHNIPALVQIMAWRRPGDKPLSEPMMVSFLTHIYVTRHQWVNPVGHWWRGWNRKLVIFNIQYLVSKHLNKS